LLKTYNRKITTRTSNLTYKSIKYKLIKIFEKKDIFFKFSIKLTRTQLQVYKKERVVYILKIKSVLLINIKKKVQ